MICTVLSVSGNRYKIACLKGTRNKDILEQARRLFLERIVRVIAREIVG
jgi:hypothetical protein